MNRRANIYSKFLGQLIRGFVTATGRAPLPVDMPQIRTLAVTLAKEQPEADVVSVTVKQGKLTVVVEPNDERSLSA